MYNAHRKAWLNLQRLTVTLVFTATTAVVLSGCDGRTAGSSQPPTAFTRVTESRTLRLGYVIASPSCFRDPQTGKLDGYSVRIVEAAARKLGIKLVWVEEATWGTMIEGLNNRYDMVGCTSWENATRASAALFTRPVVYSSVGAYVRANDKRSSRALDDLNTPAVRIATSDGELSETIADASLPRASQISLPQLTDYSQLMVEVASGKADVALMERNSAALFLRQNPGKLRELVLETGPIRVYPEAFLVRTGEFDLKYMLDAALGELLLEGYVDQAVGAFEAAPGSKLRVALPYTWHSFGGAR